MILLFERNLDMCIGRYKLSQIFEVGIKGAVCTRSERIFCIFGIVSDPHLGCSYMSLLCMPQVVKLLQKADFRSFLFVFLCFELLVDFSHF